MTKATREHPNINIIGVHFPGPEDTQRNLHSGSEGSRAQMLADMFLTDSLDPRN